MTDEEVQSVSNKISQCGAIPFVTENADIESYFVRSAHIATSVGVQQAVVEEWLDQLAKENHIKLQHAFTRKRDEVKHLLYRDNPHECPATIDLLGDAMPLPPEYRHGKFMFKKVRACLSAHFDVDVTNLLNASDTLKSAKLAEIHDGHGLV